MLFTLFKAKNLYKKIKIKKINSRFKTKVYMYLCKYLQGMETTM